MGVGWGGGGAEPPAALSFPKGSASPAPPDQLRREDPAEEAAGAALSREKLGGRRWRSDFSSAGGEDDGSCEVNGRLYRDGETFQPHCRLRCRCEDGGFTCVPLCSEDVRLPSWDCPHPRRVEVPGKCCPEWVCDQGVGLGVQPLPAQGECRAGPGLFGVVEGGRWAGDGGGVGMGEGEGLWRGGAEPLRYQDNWIHQSQGYTDKS